jgi:hypothetical protein
MKYEYSKEPNPAIVYSWLLHASLCSTSIMAEKQVGVRYDNEKFREENYLHPCPITFDRMIYS